MSDERGSERQQAEARLRRLERWRSALAAKGDKLDTRERERLAKKIDRERAALKERLSALQGDREAAIGSRASGRSDIGTFHSETADVPSADATAQPSGTPATRTGRERVRHPTRRRRIAIATSVLVLLVAGGYIGSLFLNNHAEREVEERVRTAIEELQLKEQISYSGVEVNAVLGRIRFFDVSLRSPNPHSRLEMNELQVDLAPDELARLAWDLEGTEITRVRLSLIGGSANDDRQGRDASFEEVAVGFRGSVVLDTIDEPETVHVSEVDGSLSGIRFSDAEAGLTMRIDEAGYSVSADVTLAELDRGVLEPWEYLHELEGRLAGVGIEVSEEVAPELEAFQSTFGEYGWIADLDNWSIDDSGIRVTFDPETVRVESFRFASPLLEVDGSFQIALDPSLEPVRTHGELSVSELHSDIRTVSGLYLAMLGQEVPSEGPFTVSFDFAEHSEPLIEIR